MLFRKKKQAPTVKLDGMVFKFDLSAQSWETEYEGIFVSVDGAGLELPVKPKLNDILKVVAAHGAHIDNAIDEMMWEGMNKGSAHLACIGISGDNEFSVSYLGDVTWGDLGYDLWFKDGKIINEGAGD